MKKKILYNLIGIPIIFVMILFAFSSKSEASIADFVDMVESNSSVNEVTGIEAGAITYQIRRTRAYTQSGGKIRVQFSEYIYQNGLRYSLNYVNVSWKLGLNSRSTTVSKSSAISGKTINVRASCREYKCNCYLF